MAALTEMEPGRRDPAEEREEAEREPTKAITTAPATTATPPVQNPSTAHHSGDFRSVFWYGVTYTSRPQEAAVLRLLWAEHEKGPGLGRGEAAIAEAIGSVAARFRFDHVFRVKNEQGKWMQHPAWSKMIISPQKGLFSLAAPQL